MRYSKYERDSIEDNGYLPEDEEEEVDPNLVSLAATPEGEDLYPYTVEQRLEDIRAEAAHSAAWLRFVQEKNRKAA